MPDEQPPPPAPARGPSRASVFVGGLIALVLLGLIVPAIVKVREWRNNEVCKQNLHNLAMAAHKYHNDYAVLPPGYLGPWPNETDPTPQNGPHVGVLSFLLPYLDEPIPAKAREAVLGPLAAKGPWKDEPPEPGWWTDPNRLNLGRTGIAAFRCPSAPVPEHDAEFVVALHHYFRKEQLVPEETMRAWSMSGQSAQSLSMSNYVGVSGALGQGEGSGARSGNPYLNLARFCGILGNRRSLTLKTISGCDGLSNTFLIGESLGTVQDGKVRLVHTWMGSGGMGTAGGLVGLAEEPSLHQFSSAHPRVVHFAFADGTALGLRYGWMQEFRESGQRRADSRWFRILYECSGYADGLSWSQ